MFPEILVTPVFKLVIPSSPVIFELFLVIITFSLSLITFVFLSKKAKFEEALSSAEGVFVDEPTPYTGSFYAGKNWIDFPKGMQG